MIGKKTILIVDDIEINRMVYQESLEEKYNVIEAKNGKEALEIINATHIDLMLLDIVMPVMDGKELLRYRKSHPEILEIPVIVVTALDYADMEIEVLDLEADDVLRKPFDCRVLQKRIQNVLDSRNIAALKEENLSLKRVQNLEDQLADVLGKQKSYVKVFYALLNYIPSGVTIFDLTGEDIKIIFANQSVCSLFGYKQEEYMQLIEGDAFFGVHPDDLDRIKKELKHAIETDTDFKGNLRKQRKNGEYIWITLQISIERDSNHVMGYGSYMDIGTLKERAERDYLTGVYNRQAFKELVTLELSRQSNERLILIFIDLDHFKPVNDNFGHTRGDEVLKEVANRIQAVFRDEDIVARVGGDEFCVFITHTMPKEMIVARATQLAKRLELHVEKEGKEVCVTASIGIAYSDEYEMDYDKLYNAADSAQYYAKHHGKNCYCIAGEESQLYYDEDSKKNMTDNDRR